MLLLIGMPGGSEWILIILALFTVFVMPVISIILLVRNRQLSNQIKLLTKEKSELIERLLNKR